jgi:hypothetical protein
MGITPVICDSAVHVFKTTRYRWFLRITRWFCEIETAHLGETLGEVHKVKPRAIPCIPWF